MLGIGAVLLLAGVVVLAVQLALLGGWGDHGAGGHPTSGATPPGPSPTATAAPSSAPSTVVVVQKDGGGPAELITALAGAVSAAGGVVTTVAGLRLSRRERREAVAAPTPADEPPLR
jgi:hypothetical protein